jgi:hypothetical protein
MYLCLLLFCRILAGGDCIFLNCVFLYILRLNLILCAVVGAQEIEINLDNRTRLLCLFYSSSCFSNLDSAVVYCLNQALGGRVCTSIIRLEHPK